MLKGTVKEKNIYPSIINKCDINYTPAVTYEVLV